MKAKKTLSVLLSVVLALSLLPMSALAAGNPDAGANQEPIVQGSFGEREENKAAAPRYAEIMNESATADINDSVSWHNGVIYSEAGEYTLDGSIVMNTDADGSDTNDFSGLGAAVMATGKGVVLNLENASIETTGVAKLALFTDAGAVSVVKNSTLTAKGGIVYDGYRSTADQLLMVAPPWVLGMGGSDAENAVNARTTNIMGNYSTAAYVDSTFEATGWGALSTDSGKNMHMVVVNSKVNVGKGDGYGAYTIGESTEDYYGVDMDVTTYANIMTGGKATYQSYTGGEVIAVKQYNGATDKYGVGVGGTTVAAVKSDKVASGETINSVIKSEEFAFMCHANGMDGYNIVEVLDGTTVEAGNAIFLVKKINGEFTVNNATLTSGNNTILQIIDNDDDYVGVNPFEEWGEENGYGHTKSSHMPTFNTTFHEDAGYSNNWIAPTSAAGKDGYSTSDNWVVNYNMTNTTAKGDLWNSSGYVGSNPATTMNVTLGTGAELTGMISAGAFSHDDKDFSVGDGDWTSADKLGHVSNVVSSNGVNLVNVTLSGDAAWNVTGNCIVDSLTASTSAIKADKAVTILVKGTLTLDGKVVTESTTEGNVTYMVGFSDVSDSEWYADAVNYAAAEGIVKGTGSDKFSPKGTVTRGQVALMLARLVGVEGAQDAANYGYSEAMAWAVNAGVTTETDASEAVSRQEIVSMLWLALDKPEAAGSIDSFADAASVDSACVEALKWAVGAGVIEGKTGNVLDPTGTLIRAELAQIFYNYYTMGK